MYRISKDRCVGKMFIGSVIIGSSMLPHVIIVCDVCNIGSRLSMSDRMQNALPKITSQLCVCVLVHVSCCIRS